MLIVMLMHIVALKQTLFSGFVQFGAGLSVGLSCLAAGIAIGITGDAGVRATAQQPRMFVGMVWFRFCALFVARMGVVLTDRNGLF